MGFSPMKGHPAGGHWTRSALQAVAGSLFSKGPQSLDFLPQLSEFESRLCHSPVMGPSYYICASVSPNVK